MKIKAQTLISAVLLLSATSYATAGLYRWVDDKGEVHFSDKVPVAASKKAHTKIDKSGVSRKQLDPEAKLEKQRQLDEIALAKAEEEKINKLIREKKAEIRKRDRYLLSTYENKYELITSYETKIKMLKGNSDILSAHNDRLMNKITVLKDKEQTSDVELKLVNITHTVEQYEKALEDNDKELLSLKSSYDVDLKRYTELTQ